METAESAVSLDPASTESLSSLTQLDSSRDTFETCLIQLLHAYTTNQREGNGSSAGAGPAHQSEGRASRGAGEGGAGEALPPYIDISPESLCSLSLEQVSVLVTSNSVNYEVIQQIMAQKQDCQGLPLKLSSLLPVKSARQSVSDATGSSSGASREQSSRQRTPDVASSNSAAMGAAGGGGVVNSALSASSTLPVGSALRLLSQQSLSSTNPVIQIKPEHLQLLQQQVDNHTHTHTHTHTQSI